MRHLCDEAMEMQDTHELEILHVVFTGEISTSKWEVKVTEDI